MLPPPGAPSGFAEPATSAPRQIGPFTVLDELGRGGMAQVFHVRYRGADFALKLLIHESPDVRQRLDREAKLVGSLEHPGIVSLQGAGVVEDRAFLLYDLIPEARTLSEAWARSTSESRVGLILQIADAVGFAHSRGIVHRDLKPENILVDPSGQPQVIDFGLAKQAGMERLTLSGIQLGTQAYMAPEQFSADPNLQRPAIDVWTLGVLLYEALTGRPPFAAERVSELQAKLAAGPPPSPRELNRTVSRALEAVCMQALSYEQHERQATGVEFASQLRAAILQGADPAPGLPRLLAIAATSAGLALAGVGVAWWVTQPQLTDDPPPVSQPQRTSAAALQRPYRLIERGLHPKELLARARAHLEQTPADPTAQVAEAAALTKLGDADAGLKLAERVLEKHPKNLTALHVLATAHFLAGRMDETLSACRRAQAYDPKAEFTFVYPSLVACSRGEYERCAQIADEGLAHWPQASALWAARGTARLGLSQFSQALEDLNASLARADEPMTRLNRALVYLRLGRRAESLEDLEAIRGRLRGSRPWVSTRIQCLFVLDGARAVEEARAYLEQYPETAEANFFLGEALRRQGDARGARPHLERAVRLGDSSWSDAAKRTLQDLGQ